MSFFTGIPNKSEAVGSYISKKIAEIIKDVDTTVSVEVYGSGLGRSNEDTVTDEELVKEAAAVHQEYRDVLESALTDHVSILPAALVLYDEFTSGIKDRGEVTVALQELIKNSAEYIRETGELAKVQSE